MKIVLDMTIEEHVAISVAYVVYFFQSIIIFF